MRPRAFDGEPCEWCLGHQPADCPCQPGADFLDMDRRQALSLRSHGWSLIALCGLMIDDPQSPNDVAEGAFNRRADLIAKHGDPGADWIKQERTWQMPDYLERRASRARFALLDAEWNGQGVRPSYLAPILEATAESFGGKLHIEDRP